MKLKLESWEDPNCVNKKLDSIDAIINPEDYEQTFRNNYSRPATMADSQPTLYFKNMDSNTFSLKKLIVDGTGVVSLQKHSSVEAYLKHLKKVLYNYQGSMHTPPYVRVIWGNLEFKGVCTSLKINYTLFNPEGEVLRAVVDVELKATVDPKTKELIAYKSSPDLTHQRTVKAGDTLPFMTHQIYGSSAYYLQVAMYNKMKNVYSIKPGDQVLFPPLKELKELHG